MSTHASPRVAVLGLGIMGSGMARRIAAAGFPLSVFNRTPERATALASLGARVAASPADAVRDADVVISMLADDRAARAVWLDGDGAISGMRPGTLCIESSTATVGWVRELAKAVAARGGAFLDAPVTGSRLQVAAGELVFLVGGEAAVLERARPVLACMSKAIVPLGPIGSGAMMKLINNFLSGVQLASLAEGMAMIERSGLDRAQAVEVLLGGAPGSPMVKVTSARMLAADYTPNFPLRLMHKDLVYALDEGRRLGVTLASADTARAAFERAIAAGHADRDMAAVVEPFRAQCD